MKALTVRRLTSGILFSVPIMFSPASITLGAIAGADGRAMGGVSTSLGIVGMLAWVAVVVMVLA